MSGGRSIPILHIRPRHADMEAEPLVIAERYTTGGAVLKTLRGGHGSTVILEPFEVRALVAFLSEETEGS